MKSKNTIVFLFIIFLFFSCNKAKFQYKIETNLPKETTSDIAPQLNFIDKDNQENYFTAGHYNGSLLPTDIIYAVLEDNTSNNIYINEYSNGFLRYSFFYNKSNKIDNIFIEFIIDGDNSFIMNVFDCDWDAQSASVLRTIRIKKTAGQFNYQILHSFKSYKNTKVKNTQTGQSSYEVLLGEYTDNIISEAIEWIISTGVSTEIIDNPKAEIILEKYNSTILFFKQQISEEGFDKIENGGYGNIDFLTSRLGIETILLKTDDIAYNYNVIINGYIYPALKLGEKVWITENLQTTKSNTGVEIEYFIYDNNPSYNSQYGKLYTWDVANNICPQGWSLPSTEEWNSLLNVYEGYLFAKPHLVYGGDSNFNILYAGYKNTEDEFLDIGTYTGFWTKDEFSTNKAYAFTFELKNDTIHKQTLLKENAFSVRCIRDY